MSTYSINTENESFRVDTQKIEQKLEVKKISYDVTLSRVGPQGANGVATTLGGLPVELGAISEGDLLTVSNSRWINVTRTNVTDGGNF
jgi:hypothetical protein